MAGQVLFLCFFLSLYFSLPIHRRRNNLNEFECKKLVANKRTKLYTYRTSELLKLVEICFSVSFFLIPCILLVVCMWVSKSSTWKPWFISSITCMIYLFDESVLQSDLISFSFDKLTMSAKVYSIIFFRYCIGSVELVKMPRSRCHSHDWSLLMIKAVHETNASAKKFVD